MVIPKVVVLCCRNVVDDRPRKKNKLQNIRGRNVRQFMVAQDLRCQAFLTQHVSKPTGVHVLNLFDPGERIIGLPQRTGQRSLQPAGQLSDKPRPRRPFQHMRFRGMCGRSGSRQNTQWSRR